MKLRFLTVLCVVLFVPGCKRGNSGQPPTIRQPAPEVRFRDVAAEVGLTASRHNGAFGDRWMPESIGGGGAFIDYNADGFLDVLVVNGDWWPGHPYKGTRPTLLLFRNEGGKRFTDVTKATGLAISLQGMGAAVGDYDGDGFDDLFISGVGECRLFHNVRGEKFKDVTSVSGLNDPGWSSSAAWLDYNRDGRLDLFVCHYLRWTPALNVRCGTTFPTYCRPQEYEPETCRLYKGSGDGRFQDVTKASGIQTEDSKALGVVVRDFNQDGFPDIMVANDMTPNRLFMGTRSGRFEEQGMQLGIGLTETGQVRGSMGMDAAQCWPDGGLGVAIGNFFGEGVDLYRAGTSGLFTELATQAGLRKPSQPYVTFGLLFLDADNDGDQDLYIANGNIYDNVKLMDPKQTHAQPGQLFANDGNGQFTDAGPAGDIGLPSVGRGACRGDFDNDGRVDLLLVPNSGPVRLLRNETLTPNHWLSIELLGVLRNTNGLGAQVQLEAGTLKLTAEAASGSSYLSESDQRLHFGLGGATRVDTIRVTWPDGLVSVIRDQPVDRVIPVNHPTVHYKTLGRT